VLIIDKTENENRANSLFAFILSLFVISVLNDVAMSGCFSCNKKCSQCGLNVDLKIGKKVASFLRTKVVGNKITYFGGIWFRYKRGKVTSD
jgi:hypothetical protein